jgi:hypothetical protein
MSRPYDWSALSRNQRETFSAGLTQASTSVRECMRTNPNQLSEVAVQSAQHGLAEAESARPSSIKIGIRKSQQQDDYGRLTTISGEPSARPVAKSV